jgi:hypothetical protein
MQLRLYFRRNLLRLGALFVLLAAVLPNVTYVGHWNAPEASAAHTHSGESHGDQVPASSDDHAEHCHTGPAKCSGPHAITGSIWVGEDAGLLTLDPPLRILSRSGDIYVLEKLGSKILQPPRVAV